MCFSLLMQVADLCSAAGISLPLWFVTSLRVPAQTICVLCNYGVFPGLDINISEEGPDARELIGLPKCVQQVRTRRTDTLEPSGGIAARPSSSHQSWNVPGGEQPGRTR